MFHNSFSSFAFIAHGSAHLDHLHFCSPPATIPPSFFITVVVSSSHNIIIPCILLQSFRLILTIRPTVHKQMNIPFDD